LARAAFVPLASDEGEEDLVVDEADGDAARAGPVEDPLRLPGMAAVGDLVPELIRGVLALEVGDFLVDDDALVDADLVHLEDDDRGRGVDDGAEGGAGVDVGSSPGRQQAEKEGGKNEASDVEAANEVHA